MMKINIIVSLTEVSKISITVNSVNPLSPNSDQHQISPYNISAYSIREVMRFKDMIMQDEIS